MFSFAIGIGVDNQGEAEVSILSACAATDLHMGLHNPLYALVLSHDKAK